MDLAETRSALEYQPASEQGVEISQFMYPAATIDWFSRYVVAWRLSNTLDGAFFRRGRAMSGRPAAKQVAGWADEVAAVGDRIGHHFARSEPRQRAVGYIRGLLGDAERKNGWQLAEHLGEATPDGVQHLLARADWDADAVRDDLARYAADALGDPGGVLVVDETAFPKRGDHSAGVQRQYGGALGKTACSPASLTSYSTITLLTALS